MWNTIKERLKSPVVIGEIIVAGLGLASAVTGQDYGPLANTLVAVVTAIAAVFAALNNPTTPNSF